MTEGLQVGKNRIQGPRCGVLPGALTSIAPASTPQLPSIQEGADSDGGNSSL